MDQGHRQRGVPQAMTDELPVSRGIITKLCHRILRIWCAAGTWESWVRVSFFVLLIAMSATRIVLEALPTLVFGHDNFFFLENGWRVVNGLRPQIDFWSPWGPVTFLLVGLGIKLANGAPAAIAYACVIFAAVVGLWTYGLGRTRLAPVPRALIAIYAAVLACAPYPMGLLPILLSPAMAYNRFGYALAVVALLECFQPPKGDSTVRQQWLGGASTGVALALAFFLKASYFIVLVGLVCASLILWPPRVRRLLGVLTGFVAVSLVFFGYLRFNVPAVLHALRMAAGARGQSFSPKAPLLTMASNLLPLLCVLALAVSMSFLKPRRREWPGQLYLPLWALIVYLGDIALLSTNAQTSGLPLLGALAMLMASRLADPDNRYTTEPYLFALPYYTSALVLAGLLFLPQFGADLLSFPIATMDKLHNPRGCEARFTEARVSSLILCDRDDQGDKPANGSQYTTYVNDGVALLRQHGSASDRVLLLDMQNPFPYVLGWPPARGGMAASAFNYTFSEHFRPTLDEYFGDATVLMIPKHPALVAKHYDGIYQIYGTAVENNFRLEAESEWFRLYRRK